MSSPISTTLTVWHALFLREALDRFFGSRAGWAWLIVEPAMHVAIIGIIISYYRRITPGNVDLLSWICVGMIAFFIFRRTAVQVQHAVDCNRVFFAFRQVRPFDAAVARGAVEAFSMFFVSLALLIPMAFFDKQFWPRDPLLLLIALAGLWFLALGYGLITSTIQRLIPESSHIFAILFIPLYFMSGAILPIANMPPKIQKWLMYNPIASGLEYARFAFFDHYPIVRLASLPYLFLWVLTLVTLGLILYKLFETQLIRR